MSATRLPNPNHAHSHFLQICKVQLNILCIVKVKILEHITWSINIGSPD
jgi:hypothetical protein